MKSGGGGTKGTRDLDLAMPHSDATRSCRLICACHVIASWRNDRKHTCQFFSGLSQFELEESVYLKLGHTAMLFTHNAHRSETPATGVSVGRHGAASTRLRRFRLLLEGQNAALPVGLVWHAHTVFGFVLIDYLLSSRYPPFRITGAPKNFTGL